MRVGGFVFLRQMQQHNAWALSVLESRPNKALQCDVSAFGGAAPELGR